MDENKDNKLVSETAQASAPTKLQEVDRMSLELALANRKTALAQAEKALAQNETAEMAYKYLVLQLFMKYGLTEQDGFNAAGDIIIGGGIPKDK